MSAPAPPADAAPGAFDYLKSKADPKKFDPNSENDIRMTPEALLEVQKEARKENRPEQQKPEPDDQKDKQQDKPQDKLQTKPAEKPQATKPVAAVPVKPLRSAFATALLASAAKHSSVEQTATDTHNYDKSQFQLGKLKPADLLARRNAEEKNPHGNHGNGKDKEQEEFEKFMDRVREQNEETERRYQEYLNDMIEYIDDRMEITQEEMRQIQLGMDEIRRQNQREQDTQDRVTEDIKILKPKLDASDQALADLDAQLAEQKILLSKAEEEAKLLNEDKDKLEDRIEKLTEEADNLEGKEHEAEKQTSIHDLLVRHSRIEANANLQTIQKLENNIQQSQNKIQTAKEKPFTDENGNQIHKDEKGYYLLDDAGNKQHYKEDKQEELKKKAEKESLMTPEEIAEEQKFIAKQKYLIESQKQSALESQQEGSQHQENRDLSDRDRLFYKIRREDLLKEIKSSNDNLKEMAVKSSELGVKINDLKEEIKTLEALRDQEGKNNILIREQLAQKNQELLDSQRRMNENNKKLKEEADKLEEKNKDFQKMRDLKDEYKKLGEAKTDAEKQTIQKKIQEIRDDMSPEDKRRFEQYDKKALEKRESLISEYKASQTGQSPKQTVDSVKVANTTASQLQDTPRSVGTMSAVYLDNGQIKSNVQALSQFSAAALGEMPTNTQESPSPNLVTNRTPVVSPAGARP